MYLCAWFWVCSDAVPSRTVHDAACLSRAIGDLITVAGVFLPIRYQGFRALKAGLITDTFLEAQHLFRHKKSYEE